jgi:hypothetical protein
LYIEIVGLHRYLKEYFKAYSMLEEALKLWPNNLDIQRLKENLKKYIIFYYGDNFEFNNDSNILELNEQVKKFINIIDDAEAMLFLDMYSELFGEQVDAIFRQLINKNVIDRKKIKEKYDLIQSCREWGINKAFYLKQKVDNIKILDDLVDLWKKLLESVIPYEAIIILEIHPELLSDISKFVAAEIIINARELKEFKEASSLLMRLDLVRKYTVKKTDEESLESLCVLNKMDLEDALLNKTSDNHNERFILNDEPLVGLSWVKYPRNYIWLGKIQYKREFGDYNNILIAMEKELKKIKLGHKYASDYLDEYISGFMGQGILSPIQASSIRLYTNDEFYKIINKAWRSDSIFKTKFINYSAFLLLSVFDIMKKISFNEMILYRGSNISDCNIYQKGFKFRWPFVISTTRNRRVAERYGKTMFIIHILGKRMLKDISVLSLYPEEEEVLLHPYEVFEVIENKKNNIHIKISDDLNYGILNKYLK